MSHGMFMSQSFLTAGINFTSNHYIYINNRVLFKAMQIKI